MLVFIDQQILTAYDMPILVEILADHASNWRMIGGQLGFVQHELDNIVAKVAALEAPHGYLSRMLDTWSYWPVENHKQCPTIEALEQALRSKTVGLGSVASELKSNFLQKKSGTVLLCL